MILWCGFLSSFIKSGKGNKYSVQNTIIITFVSRRDGRKQLLQLKLPKTNQRFIIKNKQK